MGNNSKWYKLFVSTFKLIKSNGSKFFGNNYFYK